MATFAELQNTSDSPKQVRKALGGVAFLAPIDADPIAALTGPDGSLQAIPSGYLPVGLVTTDGYSFGGDTETAEVTAFGYSSPVRDDIVSRTREISFTTLENYRRPILELAYGIDLGQVTQSASGEITFDHPNLPEKREYRLLVLSHDLKDGKSVYRAKFFPRVAITTIPEEAWGGDDAVQFEMTLRAYVDDELGTSERDFIAGPGVAGDTSLGFTAGV